jgi:hypothetical protein
MDERHTDRVFHSGGNEVHGNGAHHDAVGTRAFETASDAGEILPCVIPAVGFLHVDDFLKVDGVHRKRSS